jgi:hypothetical protein
VKKALTNRPDRLELLAMQAELDSIGVVPNVEERLDRLFNRIGIIYGGDFETFFRQLKREDSSAPPEPEDVTPADMAATCTDEDGA